MQYFTSVKFQLLTEMRKTNWNFFYLNYRIQKKALLTIIPRYLTSADNGPSFHRKYSILLVIDVRKLAVEMALRYSKTRRKIPSSFQSALFPFYEW